MLLKKHIFFILKTSILCCTPKIIVNFFTIHQPVGIHALIEEKKTSLLIELEDTFPEPKQEWAELLDKSKS